MKTGLTFLVLLLAVGCASAPPTAFEAKLYDIKTNSVPLVLTVTNTVYQTNAATVWQTNIVGEIVQLTNYTAVAVPVVMTITNTVTTYDYRPGTNAAAIGQIAGEIAGPFGFGDLAVAIMAGLFGLWGMIRSSKATKVAGVLAQVIETGREVLQTTPQGKQAEVAWRDWMISHQAETGTLQAVVKLLQNTVNNETAKGTAGELLKLIQETQASTGVAGKNGNA